MTEFSRVSLREATEHAQASLAATEVLINRCRNLGAARVESELDQAAQDLAGALQAFRRADEILRQKAGLLPGATSGESPAK